MLTYGLTVTSSCSLSSNCTSWNREGGAWWPLSGARHGGREPGERGSEDAAEAEAAAEIFEAEEWGEAEALESDPDGVAAAVGWRDEE